MLETVIATRFDKPVSVGRTKPYWIAATTQHGDEVELLAKLSAGCDRGVGALAVEAIAAALAIDLGLPAPEPFIVEIRQNFIDSIPTAADKNQFIRSNRIAFGSKKLPPGFSMWPSGRLVPQEMRQHALEILAFDAFIQNPDRRVTNPNMMTNGRELAIYDHELAFATRMLIGWRAPWVMGGLGHLNNGERHVFYDMLKGRPVNLSRLQGAWAGITDARLAEYQNALPPQWAAGQQDVTDALNLITDIRDNIASCIGEFVRVLG